jgi:hypothetical protein
MLSRSSIGSSALKDWCSEWFPSASAWASSFSDEVEALHNGNGTSSVILFTESSWFNISDAIP